MIKPILQQNKENTPFLGHHLRMPQPLAGCSETLKHFDEALQCFRIYALSYEVLQHFIEVLSNLTCPGMSPFWILSELS